MNHDTFIKVHNICCVVLVACSMLYCQSESSWKTAFLYSYGMVYSSQQLTTFEQDKIRQLMDFAFETTRQRIGNQTNQPMHILLKHEGDMHQPSHAKPNYGYLVVNLGLLGYEANIQSIFENLHYFKLFLHTVLHEMSHMQVYQYYGASPLHFLNEGIAESLSHLAPLDSFDDIITAWGKDAWKGQCILENLLRMDRTSFYDYEYGNPLLYYQLAGSFLGYLISEYGLTPVFDYYLHANQANIDTLALTVFEKSLDELEKAWQEKTSTTMLFPNLDLSQFGFEMIPTGLSVELFPCNTSIDGTQPVHLFVIPPPTSYIHNLIIYMDGSIVYNKHIESIVDYAYTVIEPSLEPGDHTWQVRYSLSEMNPIFSNTCVLTVP